ncbi:hypothetical protein ABZY03_08030 [Streptomyces klenkii]|uniref:hypothetical protein n=1 Tax=Streptomyces klenkii TaxID=1420899 RepID=UPI0033B7439B
MTEYLIPPPPAFPPAIGAPAPDWWDELYADDEPQPAPPAAPRLPDWWKPKPLLPPPPAPGQEPEEDLEEEPEDDRLAAGTDEPDPEEPEHEQPEEDCEEPEQPREHLVRHGPVRAVLDTVAEDPKRRRRLQLLAYNSTAAGAGWWAGIGPWVHDSLVFYGQHDTLNGVYVGCGVVAVAALLEIRSHHWRGPSNHAVMRLLGWIARIPLASAVLALALYTPDARF